MSFVCRRGHTSISDDFCDVCGAKNRDVRQSYQAQVFSTSEYPTAAPAITCPVCSTPREGTGEYCPSCGYDFVTGERFGPIILQPQVPVAPVPIPRAASTPGPTQSLVIVVSVHSEQADDVGGSVRWPDPSEHVFTLEGSSKVVGRADAPGVHIPIRGDPYVSRRHAELIQIDGRWGVRDLDSTNGTTLNGTPLVRAEVSPIEAGDVIEVGCCSKLSVLTADI